MYLVLRCSGGIARRSLGFIPGYQFFGSRQKEVPGAYSWIPIFCGKAEYMERIMSNMFWGIFDLPTPANVLSVLVLSCSEGMAERSLGNTPGYQLCF